LSDLVGGSVDDEPYAGIFLDSKRAVIEHQFAHRWVSENLSTQPTHSYGMQLPKILEFRIVSPKVCDDFRCLLFTQIDLPSKLTHYTRAVFREVDY
jgi:hypothetical protein